MSDTTQAESLIYDLDLNSDRDRIQLYRKGRVRHVWTKREAEYIHREIGRLIPKMKP